MADDAKIIDEAVEKFRALMESQLARAKKIKEDKEFTDYDALDTIVIGICGGDGIAYIESGTIIKSEFLQVLFVCNSSCLKMSQFRLAKLAFGNIFKSELNSFIAIVFNSFLLNNDAWSGFNYCYRNYFS